MIFSNASKGCLGKNYIFVDNYSAEIRMTVGRMRALRRMRLFPSLVFPFFYIYIKIIK